MAFLSMDIKVPIGFGTKQAYLQSSEQAEEKQRQKRKEIIEKSIKKNEERMNSKAPTTPSPPIHTSALFE